jgi:hypothetical protein
MVRLLKGTLRVLVTYCMRPLWRALASMGAVYVGPEAMPSKDRHGPTPRSRRRFARYVQGRLLVLPPGVGGPPAAHPERLCAELPLSEQELILAQEIWPRREPRASR